MTALVVDGLWLPGMYACIAIKFRRAGAHEIRASCVAVRSYRPFVLCIHWQIHRLQKHCPMVSITVKHTSFKHQFNHQMVIETPVACPVWCNSSHTASDCILLLLAASGNFWLPLTLTKAFSMTPIVTVTMALTMPLPMPLPASSWLFFAVHTTCHSNNVTNNDTASASSWLFLAVHTTCDNNNGINNANDSVYFWVLLALLGCSHHMSQ